MKKKYYALAVCRFLFLYLTMQMAIIQQAVAVGSLADPMSFSSLLPFLVTVYRGTPGAKNPLPDFDPMPQPVQPSQIIGDRSDAFAPLDSVVAPQYREIRSQLTFQDAIGLKLDEEESLLLAPSEFPAVAKVSDMADEHWPQLIAAESVDSDTGGIRSVFRWADQWRLNAFPDDPLLRFLAFIHGAAFCVQDNNGQLSYIIQRNGKLLSVSRFEAYLQFSLYSQSFLESLYPEIFGPSLPAGGGWHEWNRFVRKQPYPYKKQHSKKRYGAQRLVNPKRVNRERNKRSTRSEAHYSARNSEQARAPGTTSTERDGKQEPINQQKVEVIYDYKPPENGDVTGISLYAIALLNSSQQYLYCPVCTGLITEGAKACKSSPPHSVCYGCFNSMVKSGVDNIEMCVTCRGKMCRGSFNYKDAAEAVMFQCPLGCNHSCPLAFIKNHIKEHHSQLASEDRSESLGLNEQEQAIPPGHVLFYGAPLMSEHRDRIEQFLQTCRQINDPKHLQLAEAFTQAFEGLQSRCEQQSAAHNASYVFFDFRESRLDIAYLQCIRSTDRQSAECRFCHTCLPLNQGVIGVREHLNECSGVVSCPNSRDGCSFQQWPALMPQHLLNCPYNRVKCRICHQQVALPRIKMHRENCLSSVQLDQDDAIFYERTEQKPIQLYGEQDSKGTIPVYKVPGGNTYYFKISKLFYESITQGGCLRADHTIEIVGNNPNNFVDFSVQFDFDAASGSFGFIIVSADQYKLGYPEREKHRRMALPIVFNEKGGKLLNKSFLLKGRSSCDDCGCKVTEDTFTHPDPYPVCMDSLLNNQFTGDDGIRHNDDFPECVYVQIKLTPVAGLTHEDNHSH
ncbi:hypothetical protein [Endozoicomonas sp. 4G]|uniref:hypothetical protein n=1 Tax=Endozoicomonas sp. 4G TaxID=2872754 RepID=UPI002078D811|nr:hypothetical protein [Endozoicomonas sp. 4G]